MLQKWQRNQDAKKVRFETSHHDNDATNEAVSYVLVAVFIGCGIGIYCLISVTLIPILTASRIFVSFGIIGFLVAFMLRKKLRIGILDGLYYNVFAVAPICISIFLVINYLDPKSYRETYRVTSYELHGNRYEYELEGDAYAEYWRIRTINIDSRPARSAHIEFTFCDGIFGYKVMKNARLF